MHKLLFTQDVPSNHKCLIKKQFAKFESISIYKTKGFCVDCYLNRDHSLKFSAESDENNQSSSKANLPGETILRKYPPDISWISLLSFNFFDFSFLLGPNLGQMTLLSYSFFSVSLLLPICHFILKYYLTYTNLT